MEKILVDILNAGIGLLHTGVEGLGKAKEQLEKSYSDISEKGAQNTSEAAVNLRQILDKVIGDIKDFSSVAGKNYEETRTKIIENYNNITEEIKNKMPEGKIEEVKAKINEVAESIKKTKTTTAKPKA